MTLGTFKLESESAYSQGRPNPEIKMEGESDDSYDSRTWRAKMHVTEDGKIFIPGMAFKIALSEVAKYLSMKIKGAGKSTYTKHFEAGVLVTENVVLPIKASEAIPERLFVPADGKRGGGRRVWRTFPMIPKWSGELQLWIVDPVLEEATEVVVKHLEAAGQFIGVGRFRPRNNGFYGRFHVEKYKFEKV